MRMLSSKEITQTTVALRLVGNFASANCNDYIENLFKNDLLNNLVIGWRHFDGLVDLEREIGWILANLVTTYDKTIVTSLLSNHYVCYKINQNLLLDASYMN